MDTTKQRLFKDCIREALPVEEYQPWIDSLTLKSVTSSKVVISGIPHEVYLYDIRANHEILLLKILTALFREHAPFQPTCLEYWIGDSAPKSRKTSNPVPEIEKASSEEESSLQTSFVFPENSDASVKKVTVPRSAPKKKPAPSISANSTPNGAKDKGIAKKEFRNSLDDLVTGGDNDFLSKAAHAVVEMPGLAFNPFVVHGNLGTGKTHLLQGIGQALQQNTPEKQIVYVSAEQFLNDFLLHIENRKMSAFREYYRSADVFLLDDLHVLSRAKKCQTELFHTLDTLLEQGKQVVITSETALGRTKDLNHSLCSRLQSGLELEFHAPDLQTRLQILEYKAETMGYALSEMEKQYIAEHIPLNIGKMLGALTRLAAHTSLMNQDITTDLIEQLLGNLVHSETQSNKNKAQDTVHTPEDTILERVCGMFQVSKEELVSDRRARRFLQARRVYTYLLRELTSLTLVQIGQRMGRNHSTVVNTLKKVKDQMDDDVFFQRQILSLKQEFHGPSQQELPFSQRSLQK